MSLADAAKVPSYVRCRPCGHTWIVAYVPIDLDAFLRCLRRATCPMCGTTSKGLDCYEPGRTPPLDPAVPSVRRSVGRLVSHGWKKNTPSRKKVP